MNVSPSSIEATLAPSPVRVVVGITGILVWAVIHLILFYLFFTGGVVVDVLIAVARPILFPGSAAFPSASHELFDWTGPLQTGLLLAGAAGIPAGLAVFWRRRRGVLLLMFGIALIAGAWFELSAIYILLRNSLSA